MQIRITMRYHFTHFRLAFKKKQTENNKRIEEVEKNETLVHCWWEYKTVQSL